MITNALAITAIVLGIMLIVPIICHKIHIPSIVGLILVGMAIGPNGFNLIARTETIDVLGKFGMLYIMFLSGIEIDMADFKRDHKKSILFGAYTFIFPAVIGLAAGHYLLGYNWLTSILLGSMLGSHTLMTYPIVSRYNIQKNASVNIVVGGTMLAVSLSLFILAGISGFTQDSIDTLYWLKLIVGIIIFCFVVLYLFPKITQEFFKRVKDQTLDFILVMALFCLASWLADFIGLESILGAFLAGVALNRMIPNLSPLMNRINFVGNALFIPLFLLGVGMMVKFSAFFSGWSVLLIAITIVVSKMIGKGIAALIAMKQFHLSLQEGELVFALTQASAAGTLAVVTIGCNIGLFDDAILNACIIMILTLCTVSSFLTEHAAKLIALQEAATDGMQIATQQEWLLMGKRTEPMLDFAQLCAISQNEMLEVRSLQKAKDDVENEERATAIYTEKQPLGTISRIRVAFPRHAEKEGGFLACFEMIRQLASQIGADIVFYAGSETSAVLSRLCKRKKKELTATFVEMEDWEDYLMIAKEMVSDDMLVLVSARRSTVSYNPLFESIPRNIEHFYAKYNSLILYPKQAVQGQDIDIYLTDIPQSSESFSIISKIKAFLLRIWRTRQNG